MVRVNTLIMESVIDIALCNTTQHYEYSYFKRVGLNMTFPSRFWPILEKVCRVMNIRVNVGPVVCSIPLDQLGDDSEENIRKLQVECYNIEHWIDDIAHLTFPTIVVPLTGLEIQELARVTRLCQMRDFQNRDREELLSIYDKLTAVMDPGNKFYFMKLNSVSPKDQRQTIGSRNQTYLYYRNMNHAKGEFKSLCVTSPEEVIVMLCSSSRILYRLEHHLAPVSIVLRDWVEISDMMEFRCFVYDYKFRAVSQYYWQNVLPELQGTDDELIELLDGMVEFYEEHKYEIPYPDAVMDLVLMNGEWKIVEFNSFGACLNSGSALFNWVLDMEQIYRGEMAVLRVLKEEKVVREVRQRTIEQVEGDELGTETASTS